EAIEAAGDRRVLVDAGGVRHGPFDLVVIADGARSRLRAATGLVRASREYPWGALWHIGDDPDRHFDDVLFQVVEGTSRMMGMLPSGLGPEGSVPQVSLFWSLRADQVDAWRKAGLTPWKDLLRKLEPRASILLDGIERDADVVFARYWDVVLRRC